MPSTLTNAAPSSSSATPTANSCWLSWPKAGESEARLASALALFACSTFACVYAVPEISSPARRPALPRNGPSMTLHVGAFLITHLSWSSKCERLHRFRSRPALCGGCVFPSASVVLCPQGAHRRTGSGPLPLYAANAPHLSRSSRSCSHARGLWAPSCELWASALSEWWPRSTSRDAIMRRFSLWNMTSWYRN
jgi:hypothetical protein